jgi:hypothetical protein
MCGGLKGNDRNGGAGSLCHRHLLSALALLLKFETQLQRRGFQDTEACNCHFPPATKTDFFFVRSQSGGIISDGALEDLMTVAR